MSCKTQANLAQVWANASREFSEATNALTADDIGEITQVGHQHLMARAEAARLASEKVRLTLELHRREHGC